MKRQTPKRSFGTKLSANSPLIPPRSSRKRTSSAVKFVEEAVDEAVGRRDGSESGGSNGDGFERRNESGTPNRTTPAKLLEFDTPDFKIYTATPSSVDSMSPWMERTRWREGGAREELLYSSLEATSPSFRMDLSNSHPAQQLLRRGDSTSRSDGSKHDDTASPDVKSPDSAATVVPLDASSLLSERRHRPYDRPVGSPTGSIISTSAHTSASALLFSSTTNPSTQQIVHSLGPMEYAITFPPGPIPLKLEGEAQDDDESRGGGCVVSSILPQFHSMNLQYIHSSPGQPLKISQNDLLISINSISILSRPIDTVLSLLEQFESHSKTIVFRSKKKVYVDSFTSRTMRNVRSGKRVETALDKESMERELWSWVETPTKPEEGDRWVGGERRGNRMKGMETVQETSVGTTFHATDSFATPTKQPPSLFSPSAVKKLSRTPTPLKPATKWINAQASTMKKSNIRKHTPSKTPSKRIQQIGQVLVGGHDAGFERVVRLKKEVLKELHEVRLALIEEHAVKSKQGQLALESQSIPSRENSARIAAKQTQRAVVESQSSLYDEGVDGLYREVSSSENTAHVTKAETKDVLPPISREMLLNQATQLQNRLGSDGQFVERFVDMQMMLREEIAKSSSLQKEVQRLSNQKSMVKEVQQKVDQAYDATKLSVKEYEQKLHEKDQQLFTLQSKHESEMSALKSELDLASDRIAEKEKQFIILLTNLEEERSHTQTIHTLLEEAQHSKSQHEKLVAALEGEMDRKQRLMEETEAASDLKTEELNRLRSKIMELELIDGYHKGNVEKANDGSAEAVKKWSEREAVLLNMIEQQRQDFETERLSFQQREELLIEEEKVKAAAASAAHNDAVAASEKRVSELEVERDNTLHQLEEAMLCISEKEAALNTLQSEKNQRISELEAERDSAINELEEAKSSLSKSEAALVQEKEKHESHIADLSKLLERQSLVQAGQNEMVNELQTKISCLTEVIDEKDQRIEELNDEIQAFFDSTVEQSAIKAVLADNLSKHIAASEEGFTKLDELSSLVVSKINDFSGRVAKSHAATESFRCYDKELRRRIELQARELAEKEATLQTITVEASELESKVVEVATELEKSLAREQNAAKQLEAAKTELSLQSDALEKALLTRDELQSKIDEMASLNESHQTESLQRIGDLQAQRDDALQDLDETRAALAAAESLQSHSVDRIRRLETERDDILHKLESSNASFTVEEAAMRQEKEKLDSCIAGLTAQLEQLEKKVIHLSDEVESGRAKEQNAIKELDEARLALRSQTEVHEQLEMKNDQLTSLVESLETERSELIDRIQMLELEISETNVSLKNQEAKVLILSSAIEENQSTLLKLNLEKQQLENMMSAERKASSVSEALLREEIDRQKEAAKEMTRSIEKNCLLKFVNDELQAKVRSITSDLEEKEGSFASSRKEFDLALKTKEAEIAELKKQIHHLSNEALLLRDELATSQSEVSCSRYREAELKSLHFIQTSSLHKAKSELENSNASLQESLSVLDVKHNNVSDKLDTTLSSLEEKEFKLIRLVAELDSMRAEAANLACEVNNVKEERNTSNESLTQMTAEASSLREQMLERDKQLAALRTEFSKLKSENFSLESALSSTNNKMEATSLNHQLALQNLTDELETTRTEASTTVAQLKSNLETAEQLLDQGDAEIHELSAECERLESHVQDLDSQLKETQAKCKSSEVELASAIADRDDLRSSLDIASSELKSSVAEVKELNARLQSLSEELCLCKDAAAIERCSLEADKAELSETVASLKSGLAETNASQSDLISSIADLQGKLKAKESEVNQLKAQTAELGEKVENLSIELNQSKRDVMTLQQVKHEHLQEIKLLEYTKTNLTSKISHIESQAQKDHDLFDASKQEFIRDIDSKANQVVALTSQKEELMATVAKLQSVLQSAESRASKLAEDKGNLVERVASLTNQIELLECQSEGDAADFMSQLTRLEIKSKGALVAKEQKVSSLNATIENLKSEMEDLKLQHIVTEDLLRSQLLESLEAREGDAAESTSQQLELKRIIEEHLESIHAKEIEISSLHAKHEELERMIDELDSRIKQSEDKVVADKNTSQTREAALLECIKAIESELVTVTRGRDQSQSEKQSLLQSLNEKESLIAIQISRNKELECAAERLANQIQSLTNQLHSHQRSFKDTNEEYLAASAAKDREIKELKQKQVELSKALEVTKLRLSNRQIELADFIKDKERINEQRQTEKEHLLQALNEKELLVSDLASKKEELESQVEELRIRFCTFKDQLQSTQRLFDDAQEEKDQQIKQLTQHLEELTQQLETHQVAHAESISEKEVLITALSSEKNDLESTTERLCTQIKQMEEQSQQERKSSDSKMLAMQSLEKDLKSTVKNLEHQLFQIQSQSQLDREASESVRRQMLRDERNLRNAIEADKIKHSHLKEVLEAAKSTISMKENEIKGLIEERETASSEAMRTEAELKSSIDELQTNLDHEKAVRADLSSRLEALASTLSVKDEEIALLRVEGKSSQDTLESKLIKSQQNLLLHQQSSAKTESKLKTQIELLEREVASIKDTEQSLTKQLKVVRNDLRTAIDNNNDLKALKENLASECNEANRLLAALNSELASCQDDLKNERALHQEDRKSKEDLRLKLQEAMEWSDSLRSDVIAKEVLLREKEREITSLSEDMKLTKASHEARISELKMEHESTIKMQDEKAHEEISTLKSQLQCCQVELSSAKQSHQQDQVQIDELRSNLQEAIVWSDSLRSNIAKKEESLNKKQHEISSLSANLESLKFSSEAAISRLNDATEVQLNHAQNELSMLMSELKSCEEKLADERRRRQDDQAEMEDLRKKLKKSDICSDSLRSELAEREKSIVEKESKIAFLSAEIESIQKSSEIVSQITAEYHSTQLQLDGAESELSSIKSELQTCRNELASERSAHHEDQVKLEDLQLKLEESVKCCAALKADISKKEELLSKKEKEIKTLLADIETVEASHQLSLQRYQEDLASEKALHQEDSSAVEELRCQLQIANADSDSLKAVLTEKEGLLCHKDDEIQSLKAIVDSLEASSEAAAAQAQDEMSAIRSELQACREELASERSSNQKELAAMKELRRSLGEKEQMIRQKSEELIQVSERIQIVEKNYTVVQARMKDILEVMSVGDTYDNDCDIISMISKLLSSEKQLTKQHAEINACYNEAVDENKALRADIDSKVTTLHEVLYSIHREICQLSKELVSTRSAAASCIQDVKKGLESAMADIVQYYECKSTNYRAIINELNQIVESQQTSVAHKSDVQDEVTNVLSDQQSSTIHKLSSQLECKDSTIERLTNDLAMIRDELVTSRAETSCWKEIFNSYHSERVLLHQEIRNILNDSSTTNDTDDDVYDDCLHPYDRFLNYVECELLDLMLLHNANVVDEGCFTSKPQLIKSLLQSIKLTALSIEQKTVDPNQTSDSQQIQHILSDIDSAKHQVVSMSNKLEFAADSREYLANALAVEQERTSLLEQLVSEKSADLEASTKLLLQTQDQHRRLQSKYAHAEAEIESCQKLAVELKKIIVEKNTDIQNMEGTIFDLQFKLDDITARSHGLMASFDGVDHAEQDFLAENEAADRINSSAVRHEQLSEKLSRLEETIFQMNQDSAQTSSMHQELVDGLEAECQRLTDEIDEARYYIFSLENMQTALEGNIASLKKDNEAKTRINMDLESALTILKQQKASADEDRHIVVWEVAKLTDAVISYASCFEGFSKDLQAPSSWSVNLKFISEFLHHLQSSRESVYCTDVAITPKARGRGTKVTFAGLPEHSDMLVGINGMKDTIKNVLASPRLTPAKNGERNSEEDGLYHDLVKAVDQLELLSEKYQECQELWSGKESTFISQIEDLENQVHAKATNLELEQARRHRVTTIVLANIHRRRHCTVLRRAFQTWSSQAKLRKHLTIIRDMAQELLQTRKKVLLLKSHFDDTDS